MRRRRFEQLSEGPGYRLLRRHRAWGTARTVSILRKVLAAYHARFAAGPLVWVHDISSRWGGFLPPHKSHRLGRDVDIRIIHHQIELEKPRKRRNRQVFAAPENWFLLQTLLATGEVQYIFVDRRVQGRLYREAVRQGVPKTLLREAFQFPRPKHKRKGIIRHEPHHRSHFHVRFRRPTPPPEAVAHLSPVTTAP